MPEDSNDTLVIRKMIAASREEVFAAWLDPESIRHWMCPGHILTTEAQLDARVGGTFRIVMKGKTEDYEHTGEYRVIDRPAKLVFTWISKGTGYQPSLVTVQFFDRGGQTELVLTHERLPSAEAVQGHKAGWGEIADHLADHLAKGTRKTT